MYLRIHRIHYFVVKVLLIAASFAFTSVIAAQQIETAAVAEIVAAARSNRFEIVSKQLGNLSRIDLKETLFRAIDDNLPALLEGILKFGADPNAMRDDGSNFTPLEVARNRLRTNAVAILTNSSKTERRGFNDLMLAVVLDDFATAETLVKQRPALVAAKDAARRDAMFEAIRHGNSRMVVLLTLHGATHRYSLSELSIIRGDTNSIALAIRSGWNVNPRPHPIYGETPLMMAVHFGQEQVAQQLLAHGADPEAQTRAWGTGLLLASRKGHIQLVRILLNNGGDPNHGVEGVTPLAGALQRGHEEVALLLLDSGAEPELWIQSGKESLIRSAQRKGLPNVLKRLQ